MKNKNNTSPHVDSEGNVQAPVKVGEPLNLIDNECPFVQMSSPNATVSPNVAGTDRLSTTTEDQHSSLDEPIRRRSWMGWFLWGDGVPPTDNDSEEWDYFSYQRKTGNRQTSAQWQAIRMDQQPIYLDPLRINYNWPPGKFGFKQKPLENFGSAVSYWESKKIVRGVNVSMPFPFLCNFGDNNPKLPKQWRRPFLTL